MNSVLALRPFVPAKDFDVSKRFYQTLDFTLTLDNSVLAILKQESFSFILQNYYVKDFAENCVVQLMVRDADAWWQRIDTDALIAEFGVRKPRPPAVQPWGMKVGFVFDPSGVLWHIAESVF